MSRIQQFSRRLPKAGVKISGLIALSVVCLYAGAGAYAQTTYPSAPSGTVGPSISLVPRPIDPDGFDITSFNTLVTPPGFATMNDPTNTAQAVIGPDDGGTLTVGSHNLALFGALFNNKTSQDIGTFELLFDTPVTIPTISVDTFERNDDLTFPAGPLTPTWNFVQNNTLDGNILHWTITFTENPNFPWFPQGDDNPFVTFTVLGSGFAPGTSIQFSYIANASNAPEPGVPVLAAALSAAGLGVGLRRRQRATKRACRASK